MKTYNLKDAIREFINQSPGVSIYDFNDLKEYNITQTVVGRQKKYALELLEIAQSIGIPDAILLEHVPPEFEVRVLRNGYSIRYKENKYWPSEFRPAAARWLAQAIKAYEARHGENEVDDEGIPLYLPRRLAKFFVSPGQHAHAATA